MILSLFMAWCFLINTGFESLTFRSFYFWQTKNTFCKCNIETELGWNENNANPQEAVTSAHKWPHNRRRLSVILVIWHLILLGCNILLCYFLLLYCFPGKISYPILNHDLLSFNSFKVPKESGIFSRRGVASQSEQGNIRLWLGNYAYSGKYSWLFRYF